MKNIFAAVLLLITASQNGFAFELPFFKSTPARQKLYSELNSIGFSIYGTFNGSHEKFKGEGKDDEFSPVGFKTYQLGPKVKQQQGLGGANIWVTTAGTTVSKISLFYNFLAADGLKCDREGLAKFLGVKPSDVVFRDDETLGRMFKAGVYDKEGDLNINASCGTVPVITFEEPYSNSEEKLPGPVCSVNTCPVPWAPLIMAKKFYLMSTDRVIGGLSSEQALKEVADFLRNKYVHTYTKFLSDTISNAAKKPTETENLRKLLTEYKDVALDKKFVDQLMTRLRAEIKN